jgi:hypothetical protein
MVASAARRRLEADHSEKAAQIIKIQKTRFFEVFLQILEQLSTSLEHMPDEIMKEFTAERLFDLVIDFWEDTWDELDKIVERLSQYKTIRHRLNYLLKLNA